MKKDLLNELQTIWPTIVETRTRLLSGTFSRLSFLRRRESESSSTSSLSSSQNKTNSIMQQCWSTCEPELSVERSTFHNALTPCEFCFEPSDSVITTGTSNDTRDRICSDPVSVPDSLALFNSQQQPQPQSQSSGYDSPFGNGLSPTKNYWSSDIPDTPSTQSMTTDDILNDQDRSLCDESSTTDCCDEQDDDDSFEVLSFDAPPESTLYIKGNFPMTHSKKTLEDYKITLHNYDEICSLEFPHTTSESQNNICCCCNTPFSCISNLPPRRCYYYGKLYCHRCHIMDSACIPAKLIKSFDPHLYPVCRRAKSILQLNFYQPVFDIQHDNGNLYILSGTLSEIKFLRLQFQYFYAYLSTCTRIDSKLHENIFQEFYARDYLYQSVHLYSMNDLLSLKKILHLLSVASVRAKKHIHQCIICREKGFTCEICKKRTDILYPFDDVRTIGQCNLCSNIYHRQCWDNIDHDCPKCYRLIQRRCEQDITI